MIMIVHKLKYNPCFFFFFVDSSLFCDEAKNVRQSRPYKDEGERH